LGFGVVGFSSRKSLKLIETRESVPMRTPGIVMMQSSD